MDENKSNTKDNKKYPGYPHYPADQDALRNINVDDEERDNDNDSDIVMGTDADVSKEDLELLNRSEQNMSIPDDISLAKAELEHTDADGDRLNEAITDGYTGDDLDIPGSELDNSDENIGEEDEENNYYSLGGDDKENLEENKED